MFLFPSPSPLKPLLINLKEPLKNSSPSFWRQGRLQFRPPFEEVRARYFREMKRFISIPNQFKGVSAQEEDLIFSVMIDRNASGFLTIFSKAEDLFNRLQAIQHKFKVTEWQMILSFRNHFYCYLWGHHMYTDSTICFLKLCFFSYQHFLLVNAVFYLSLKSEWKSPTPDFSFVNTFTSLFI